MSIFSPKTQKCHVYFCTTKGGGVGPEGTQITKVCTNVHTCMYICHELKKLYKILRLLLLYSFIAKKVKVRIIEQKNVGIIFYYS